MDRRNMLLTLAQRITDTATQGDWESLRRIDAEMAAGLPGVLAAAPLNLAERNAALALRAAHQAALQRCGRALAGLEARLHAMRENREAWMAYAGVAEVGETE